MTSQYNSAFSIHNSALIGHAHFCHAHLVAAHAQHRRNGLHDGLAHDQVVAAAAQHRYAPHLRLLAPGEVAATASLQIFGPDGVVSLPGTEAIKLDPGVVTDVTLGGLSPGYYTVVATADQPIVAGAWLDRAGPANPALANDEQQYDRAWLASSSSDAAASGGTARGTVALIPGTTSQLVLSALAAGADSAGAGGTGTGSASAGAASAGAGRGFSGTLTAYSATGQRLGQIAVTVPADSTITMSPADVRTPPSPEPGATPSGEGDATPSGTQDPTPEPAVITLVGSGADMAWSVVATADGAAAGNGTTNGDGTTTGNGAAGGSAHDSLITVLQPETWRATPQSVRVSRDDRLGLPG